MDKHPRRQPFRLLHSAAFVLLSIFFITRITFRVSPFNRETDQLLIQQAATMMIPQEKDKNAIVEKRKITVPNVPPVPTVPQHYPRLILGHSTGHTASYSIHNAITLPGCPWSRQDKTKLEMENLDNNTISSINIHLDSQSTRPLLLMPKFEWTGPGERRWKHGWLNETSSERSCKLTEKHLFRKLFEYIHRVQTPDNTTQSTVHHKKTKSKNDEIIDMSNTIFMDMGHFHNRGHVLECLAYMLQQKLTLIRIRRNRHQIANSFAAKFETPCIRDHEHIVLPPPPNNTRGRRKRIAPGLAICPRSGEKVGPVYLKVPGGDTVWDDILTPFQRFLCHQPSWK
ncbi:hypothetical protein IV203_023012 [Nitzschia inconspicua]|uniref:Uncharacterized protein n=1 Tax=Nitzschia inconspicua TaxID=303405 RepID=A0A9K3KCW2_9STRA|nr:hypothetical protein IV203_023012 [Nitzschia inconspicua]